MKTLCIIPPSVPSYFNAGHHLPVFQVGAYLRAQGLSNDVVCMDGAVMNMTWKDVCKLLRREYDVIAVMNDFDQVDTFRRFTYYVKQLSPQAKLVTFGRLSKQVPQFFQQYEFDGIVASGDYEAGVAEFIRVLKGQQTQAAGVYLRSDGYREPQVGTFLPSDEWALPNIDEIPYEAYDNMYADDLQKFCGIPQRRELVVPAVRGCPIGCDFCDVPSMQGKKERRLPVAEAIGYIEDAFRRAKFEYVSFYAPTFTLNKQWVRDLCDELIARGSPYPWKCVTTLGHLNEELVELMAKSGCIRVSIGLETLDNGAFRSLPKIKQDSEAALKNMCRVFERVGIELNCFVILGLPGDSYEGVEYTVRTVLEHNARVRPTIYTPYHLIRGDMDEFEIGKFNRQILLEGIVEPQLATKYHDLFHANPEDRATQVMEQIPTRRPPAMTTQVQFDGEPSAKAAPGGGIS